MMFNLKFIFLSFLLLYINPVSSIEPEVEIESKILGAELTSIKYKGVEYLYDGKSPAYWNQSSPILFPIVGKLRYDETIINGKEYQIPKHGFAMNMDFEEIGKHSYKLISNSETLSKFPFEFELYVNYKTEKNKLFFNYTVINKTPGETMLFGIGGHPGFRCDYYKEKCSIEFEKEENEIKIIPVNITMGLMSNEIIDGNTVIENKKILKIKNNSFKNDAIVFTDMKSTSVILKDDGKNILKFNFEGFKYLGVWSAVGNAPYVCLEPWYNTPDYVNSSKEFKEKKDIIELKPNEKFEIGFSVEFFDNNDKTDNAKRLNSLSLLAFISLMIILF